MQAGGRPWLWGLIGTASLLVIFFVFILLLTLLLTGGEGLTDSGTKIGVVAIERALNRHSGAHRLNRAAELRNHAVTGGTENASRVFIDELGDRPAVPLQRPQGGVLVGSHEAAVTGYVRR